MLAVTLYTSSPGTRLIRDVLRLNGDDVHTARLAESTTTSAVPFSSPTAGWATTWKFDGLPSTINSSLGCGNSVACATPNPGALSSGSRLSKLPATTFGRR